MQGLCIWQGLTLRRYVERRGLVVQRTASLPMRHFSLWLCSGKVFDVMSVWALLLFVRHHKSSAGRCSMMQRSRESLISPGQGACNPGNFTLLEVEVAQVTEVGVAVSILHARARRLGGVVVTPTPVVDARRVFGKPSRLLVGRPRKAPAPTAVPAPAPAWMTAQVWRRLGRVIQET